jgi:hypothetical protein
MPITQNLSIPQLSSMYNVVVVPPRGFKHCTPTEPHLQPAATDDPTAHPHVVAQHHVYMRSM